MKKPKFILRRMENQISRNGSKPKLWITWDVMREYQDGEEFVCEFADKFEKLARKAVRALNATK